MCPKINYEYVMSVETTQLLDKNSITIILILTLKQKYIQCFETCCRSGVWVCIVRLQVLWIWRGVNFWRAASILRLTKTGRIGIARFRFLVTSKPRAKHLKKSPRSSSSSITASSSVKAATATAQLQPPPPAVFSFEKQGRTSKSSTTRIKPAWQHFVVTTLMLYKCLTNPIKQYILCSTAGE